MKLPEVVLIVCLVLFAGWCFGQLFAELATVQTNVYKTITK